MKNIKVIYYVAAEKGGAISILNMYYERAKNDLSTQYYFIISNDFIEPKKNISVLTYYWIKRSLFHRLFFEIFFAHRILNDINPDSIISLQNLPVLFLNPIIQEIYIHQSLPFSKFKFSIFSSPLVWFYQNIYSLLLKFLIKGNNKILVQTHWMKRLIIKKLKINEDNVRVEFPSILLPLDSYNYNYLPHVKVNKYTMIYPAEALIYKNHMNILFALKKLNEIKESNLNFLFTFNYNSNKLAKRIFNFTVTNKLKVSFIGKLDRFQLLSSISQSSLIFPSLVETIGLPLLEAQKVNSFILVSDLEFSRETIGNNYDRVIFFDPNDIISITKALGNYESIISN
jgi:hypothetical protein